MALCAWLLQARPVAGGRSIGPGSFAEFFVFAGLAFFGGTSIVLAAKLLRSGPVVSVGPRGLFDRRLSRDWIPWDAVLAVAETRMLDQRWLTLHVDPARDASLPIRKTARFLVRLNKPFGFSGYQISASELKGGFPPLAEAVRHVWPRRR